MRLKIAWDFPLPAEEDKPATRINTVDVLNKGRVAFCM